MTPRRVLLAILAALLLGLAPSLSWATVIDLTTEGSSGTDGVALFVWTPAQPTGTGFIDSFVEIGQPGGKHPLVQAYNTRVNNVFDNGSSDQFNHEITVGDAPVVTINGVQYREFLLDINQTATEDGRLLSLDEIQVFTSNTPNQSTESFNAVGVVALDGTLIYRLDSAMDNWIKLNYFLNHGSGSGDMFMYIPSALFGPDDSRFVYLYSRFGENHRNTDGFEEWAVLERPGQAAEVPEPSMLSFLSLGLAGLGATAWRRRQGE